MAIKGVVKGEKGLFMAASNVMSPFAKKACFNRFHSIGTE